VRRFAKPRAGASSIPFPKTPSLSAGGCDFGARDGNGHANADVWTAEVLPSVITVTTLPSGLADPRYRLRGWSNDLAVVGEGDVVLERGGALMRLHVKGGAEPPAALLPFDELFEISVATASFWRCVPSMVGSRGLSIVRSRARSSRSGRSRSGTGFHTTFATGPLARFAWASA